VPLPHSLTFEQLRDHLAVDLSYAATPWEEDPALLSRAAQWHTALVSEGVSWLPLSLVLDLSAALWRGPAGRWRSEEEYASWPEEERATRLRYETELLHAVARHRPLRELFELSAAVTDALTLHALRLICRRLAPRYPRDLSYHPRPLREVVARGLLGVRHDAAALAAFDEALAAVAGEGARAARRLERFLDALAATLDWRELVGEADLFELRRLDRLSSDDLRLGCRQLMELAERLGALEPGRVRLPREDALADSAFRDDTTYPTGGLTELTTSGAWENLVPSELVYIEKSAPGEVDLFDVRFVERELLFYLRDEGQLSCKRRAVHFVVDLGPYYWVKTRGYPLPFAGLASALCVALLRDLMALYQGDALVFHVHVLTRGTPLGAVAAELELLRLVLGDEEQRGLLRVHPPAEELNDALLDDPRRERRVWALVEGARREAWGARLRALRAEGVSAVCASVEPAPALDLREPPAPPRRQASYAEVAVPLDGAPLEALRALRAWLAARLVGGRLSAEQAGAAGAAL